MKTRLSILIVLMFVIQLTYGQNYGIKGGVNFANMTISALGIGVTPKSLTAVHVGFVGEFDMKGNLTFNTGLLYSIKGFNMSAGGESVTETLNYLVVPLNFAYKFPINDKSKFLIQAGPYLGYALSGKDKYNGESSDVEFGDGGMKRMDYGLGFGGGVDFGSVVLSLNYELGLANLVDGSDVDASAKNKVVQLSIAYMFGKKK